jgi:hypothetical protein
MIDCRLPLLPAVDYGPATTTMRIRAPVAMHAAIGAALRRRDVCLP